jgi:predicted sulfurtransferase
MATMFISSEGINRSWSVTRNQTNMFITSNKKLIAVLYRKY